MVHVQLTRHLFQFFPALEGRELVVEARTVGELVKALEELAPGFEFYICDERGRLRQHVNIFIGRDLVTDRTTLADPLEPSSRVHIMQALSGG